MRKQNLTVVPDGAQPIKLTVKQAAGRSQRDLLISLRDCIAAEIDKGVPAHALAPLSRQLRDLGREIEAIDAAAAQEAAEDERVPDEEFDASAI